MIFIYLNNDTHKKKNIKNPEKNKLDETKLIIANIDISKNNSKEKIPSLSCTFHINSNIKKR